MQKSYLLLRNNQQSGPYSLEELTHMSLQAKDLIWIIGQSAGWRYPEEIAALQPFLQGVQAPMSSGATVGRNQPKQPALPTQHQQAHQKDTPPRHIYVSFPAANAPSASGQETASMSFEERVEKMRQRVASVNTEKATTEEPEVETKYSRSLDDIKAEYASWMHKRKRKQKLSLKLATMVVVSLVAAISMIWMASQLFSRPSDKVLVNNSRVPSDFYPTVVMPPTPVITDQAAKSEKSGLAIKAKETSHKAAAIKRVVPKPDTQTKTGEPVAPLKDELIAVADTMDEPAIEAQAEAPPGKPLSVAEQLHINAEYVAASKRSSGVDGLAVTVKNNSGQIMKVVAVDVIYFTEGMTELERKTLYFSNLQPGQTLTRNAPAHKKAEGAYAQLGLISSEEGSIFYASNNK